MARVQKLVPDKIIFPSHNKKVYKQRGFEPPHMVLRKSAKSALKINLLAIAMASIAGAMAYLTEKPFLVFVNACTGALCLSRIPSILKQLNRADNSEKTYKAFKKDYCDAVTVELEEKFK